MIDQRATRLTYAGLDMLAQCQQGAELHFTRVAMGDGSIAEGQDIRAFTDLVSHKMDLPIRSIEITGIGTTTMQASLNNAQLQAGFFAKEVGIFASIGVGGEEALYAYRNTGLDSEYVPAGGGTEIWDILYSVITVVDNAENITANLDGSIGYVTQTAFNDHINSITPHPNAPSLKGEISDPTGLWGYKNDRHLHPVGIDDARLMILGDMSSFPVVNSRLKQAEREIANIALRMEAENMMPDSNMLLAENFTDPDSIDMFAVKVLSCAAGDDSIDVQNNYGVLIGSWYWITDGVHSEYVQVKSTIKNGDIYRILINSDLVNTYSLDTTYIYRTTAYISDTGIVYGSGDVVSKEWKPPLEWEGMEQGAVDDVVVALDTSVANTDNFTKSGDIVFTAGNLISID